ncbi:hypothetical protein ACAG24_019190 [Mycobacterium sp. pW049]|uniref:hypothetical protein n=1 Tax=[Mycobacterium] bulgaricum TaxID=3238985 RepID=UPI00351B718B
MIGVLDLSESRIRLAAARDQCDELLAVFKGWMASDGIAVVTVRDPQFVHYSWQVRVTNPPTKNLPLMTGEIINNVRSALEYLAFQIYLKAGSPDGKKAGSVAFPILNTPGSWDSVVKKKVPGVWAEAADRLKAAQPFSQHGEDVHALPTLRGLGGTDKHRNLVLCAAAAWSVGAVGPKGPGFGVQMRMNRADGDLDKGLVVPIVPGTAVEVAAVFAYPDPKPFHDSVMKWTSEIAFHEPPPPDVDFGFRANNGVEISLFGLPDLVDHVISIVETFDDLPGPPPSPETDDASHD